MFEPIIDIFLLAFVVVFTGGWIIVANIQKSRGERDGNWHPWGRYKMRRLSDGKWQVREMTNQEASEETDRWAW